MKKVPGGTQIFLIFGVLVAIIVCEGFVPAEPKSKNFSQHYVSASGMQNYVVWSPLAPSTFEKGGISLEDGSQIAKDEDYLGAVLKQWKSETRTVEAETKPFEYLDDNKGNLFGRLVRRKVEPKDDDDEEATNNKKLPGILLFHTGAGPLDVSLFYKADCLVQKMDCIVLICDIISDCYGWAWGKDRTQYTSVRDALLKDDATMLRDRAASAANAICCVPEVDPQRLAAMGWCLGGQPILELGRTQSAAFSVRAMATFHGVFHRDEEVALTVKDESSDSSSSGGKILICNGKDDPFVSADNLKDAQKVFESGGWTVDIHQYEGAKHGFSNPAQDFNENPSFGYNEEAATKSWNAALELLENELYS